MRLLSHAALACTIVALGACRDATAPSAPEVAVKGVTLERHHCDVIEPTVYCSVSLVVSTVDRSGALAAGTVTVTKNDLAFGTMNTDALGVGSFSAEWQNEVKFVLCGDFGSCHTYTHRIIR